MYLREREKERYNALRNIRDVQIFILLKKIKCLKLIKLIKKIIT